MDDPRAVLGGLAAGRDEIAAARRGAREGQRNAPGLGARRRRLLADHRLADRILDAPDDWLDEVEPLLEAEAAGA